MTCPNRDGKVGTTGCIFCSQGGSGDFAASKYLSIPEQIEEAKLLISTKVRRNIKVGDDSYNVSDDGLAPDDAKMNKVKYIAYFQAYTNTYGPIDKLRSVFFEAINHPDIVALSIATSPD